MRQEETAAEYYKLIAILRRQYRIILAASWEKIYSRIGRSREATEPNMRIYYMAGSASGQDEVNPVF